MQQRQTWIDILKGMGIICVVVGHISYNRLLVRELFMFHIPLFFLVGGWLHNTAMPQRAYFNLKARALLLPYASFLLILWPLEMLVDYPGQSWSAAWSASNLFRPMLLGGSLLTGFAAVFWFVTCYFLTQQLVHFLLRRYTLGRCAILCAFMLACAYLSAALLPQWSLPWSANIVLMAAPMYFIGHVARLYRFNGWTPYFAALALLGWLLNGIDAHNSFDMRQADYGLPVLTFVGALAVVAVLAALARHLQTQLAGRMLAAVGGASMTIMFLHQFVQLMMAKKLGITQAPARIAVALALCYLVHRLLKASPLAARVFLGLPGPAARIHLGREPI